MRVTSGTAKGHTLRLPSGPRIRPTLDKTREAVFGILGGQVASSRFLDLFAGTGANGIEALSRGAAHAVFVDTSRHCVEAIRRNLEKTAMTDKAEIIRTDALAFLARRHSSPPREPGVFDIVFADPPYRKILGAGKAACPISERALQLLSSGAILKHNASVILEHSPITSLPENMGKLVLWKGRRYGSTAISIYRVV
jgi:16S rRNA (guanine(966)-N(2))-methyltransferase RsmD